MDVKPQRRWPRVLGLIGLVGGTLAVLGAAGALFGFRSFGIAFLLNWMVMTSVALAESWLGFSLSLPHSYYRWFPFERRGRVYRRLGVLVFKRILFWTRLSGLNPSIRYSGGRTSLGALESRMRQAEAAHVLVLVVVLAATGIAVVRGWWALTVWLSVFNGLMNGYPIMLQRYNRGRLSAVIETPVGRCALAKGEEI